MGNHKIDRINEDIRRDMTDILRSVKDYRVQGLITVIRVETTSDLSVAKVYVSSMESEENTRLAVEGLKSASGYIRSQLSRRLGLRKVPELRFIADHSAEYSITVEKMLREVLPPEEDEKQE